MTADELMRELTLAMLYLTSWEERAGDFVQRRAWKGYRFEDLNALSDEGLVQGSRSAKSVWLTQDGQRRATAFLHSSFGL